MLFKHSNATLLPMIWSGQFSDYKLQCGAEIIDVHKMILAARSPFFVELMMKNPQHCVITNIDMETLRLLDDEENRDWQYGKRSGSGVK